MSELKSESRLMTWFKLGRVSNLPTVWSNTLVGLAVGVSGNAASTASGLQMPSALTILFALVAMSLFYVGGMFLNDAFDAEIDAIERPERPIPSGIVSKRSVFVAGFSLLAAGVAVVAVVKLLITGGALLPALVASLLLGFCIVLYNVWHKANPISPLIMGLCRVLVYLTTALLVASSMNLFMLLACLALLAYLIGLTAIAKQENLNQVSNFWPMLLLFLPILVWLSGGSWNWLTLATSVLLLVWVSRACYVLASRAPGCIPKAVSSMLAGISLVDAVALASLASRGETGFQLQSMSAGNIAWVGLCIVCFALTLAFQRVVPGT